MHLLLGSAGRENRPENSGRRTTSTHNREAAITVILRSLETVSREIYSDPPSVLFLIFIKMFLKLSVRVYVSNLADVTNKTVVVCKVCVHKSEGTVHPDEVPV